MDLSEGTSPSGSYDEGSRSTPSNLPKAQTRQRKKKTSDSKDEDFEIEEVISKKKVLKKEYADAASTKPDQHKKAPARRVPMSKARGPTEETMVFTLEQRRGEEGKKRVRKTTARVLGNPSMRRDCASEEEEEEEDAAPAPPAKSQKLMGDAIKSGAAPSKPKTAPKAPAQASKITPKRSTTNIPAAEKNKAPVPEVEEEDVEAQVLRKLKPKIPDHDDNHPVAENMKERKDACLRLRRQADPYAVRRRIAVDYIFHTKEQQDFYEIVLLDKKSIVSDMKWVDWEYIDEN